MQAIALLTIFQITFYTIKHIHSIGSQTAINSIFTEIMPFSLGNIIAFSYRCNASYTIAVTEIVPIAVNFSPGICIEARSKIVPVAVKRVHPNTGDQLTIVLKLQVELTNLSRSTYCPIIFEVVPVAINGLPTISQFAQVAVIPSIFGLEHTSQLSLANVDTILTEVVVEAFDFLDTG